MVYEMALTAECGKKFIHDLQQTYCFKWDRILIDGFQYRFEVSSYLFNVKIADNILTMDMYLNMNDPVPMQYQPKLFRVSKDLGQNWYMNDELPEDTRVFVSNCVSRFIQVHERLESAVGGVKRGST